MLEARRKDEDRVLISVAASAGPSAGDTPPPD